MQKQVELLGMIVEVMDASSPSGYSSMECEFDHEVYEGGWSVGSKFSYVIAGKQVSESLVDPEGSLSDLVHELHKQMKTQTGGDWSSFLLSIDAEGKATTKFVY